MLTWRSRIAAKELSDRKKKTAPKPKRLGAVSFLASRNCDPAHAAPPDESCRRSSLEDR